jgi:hypothetical protein
MQPVAVATPAGTPTETELNSVAWIRERTIPTERPPLVGEVSANFCAWRVQRGQLDGFLRPYFRISRPESLFSFASSSPVVLESLSGPRSRPTIYQKTWQCRDSNPDIGICSQELWPLDLEGGPNYGTLVFPSFINLLPIPCRCTLPKCLISYTKHYRFSAYTSWSSAFPLKRPTILPNSSM